MVKDLDAIFTGKGEVAGFEFTLVAKTDKGYVYEVNQSDDQTHYEVFRKKLTPVCIDFENRIYSETDKKVIYPNSKHFGVWAWTTHILNAALWKLKQFEDENINGSEKIK